ncbi:MAG: PIN domain-containing protein [Candidatus Altiarchaeota archaeon]|nr:PIN domain-containing protein [Candidatus Altiarchaeota archaeon]
MPPLVFLDSNVFIRGYSRPDSNSARILGLMDERKIAVAVSEKVLEELRTYFTTYYGKDVWSSVYAHVSTLAKVVYRDEITEEESRWKGRIKDKDLEHLATVKTLKIACMVSYDKDFSGFSEHRTPKKFIKEFGLKESASEY